MLPVFSLPTSTTLLVVAGALAAALLYFGLRDRARSGLRRALAYVVAALFTASLVGHCAWGLGALFDHYLVSYWGMSAGSFALVFLWAGLSGLPVSVLCLRSANERAPLTMSVDALPLAPRAEPKVTALIDRRQLLKASALAMPGAGVTTAASGFTLALDTKTPTRVLRFDELPEALDGLRILQLSDMHLGFGRLLSDVERVFDRLAQRVGRPDLVVLTGDIAENPALLPAMLQLVSGLAPRFGAYAALGNHEHLVGRQKALASYEASGVHLLLDEGAHVSIGEAELYLAGVDDPVLVHTDVRPLLLPRIERALRDAHEGAFRLLLSHRPEGFDIAWTRGVDLTLSGHTHGGQIGFAGKSAFEPFARDGYLWGPYQRGASRLYTTSGFGAWFPFRLGCSAEAPIIELRRSRPRPW